jgi:NTP pyrophosphatase (non-canonical NTP hydrolase)
MKSHEQLHLNTSVSLLVAIAHGQSKDAGWWIDPKTGLDLIEVINNPSGPYEALLGGALVAQKLCLVHSEVSEGMEGSRKNLMDDKLPHRKMIEVELADAVIRIADLAGALGLDLGGAVVEKLAFNQSRPDHKLENRVKEGGKAY